MVLNEMHDAMTSSNIIAPSYVLFKITTNIHTYFVFVERTVVIS